MELQICLLFTTLLVVCGADIRPAGWLDKVVAHWKKSFVDDFDQLGPFNLDASIESAPPGYQDSPNWDFDSVSRLLALLSVSETGQPTLNSLRRMLAPTRRMMMEVPGLTVGPFIPRSIYHNRNRKHRAGMNARAGGMHYRSGMNGRSGMNYRSDMKVPVGVRNPWKRTGNNHMGMNYRMANNPKEIANKRMAMASNRMGMANNRKGVAYGRKGTQSKTGRKQMEIVKTLKEDRQLSDFQMSFKLFPSIRDKILNDIYYDEEQYDYEDASPEYDYKLVGENITANGSMDDAIVLVRNPVEARLPSARISVKLLKEILTARAIAARIMPTMKTTRFSWKPTDMTTPLNNGTSENSTTSHGAATGTGDDAPTTDGSGGGAPNADAGGGETTMAAGDGDAAVDGGGDPPPDDAPPPEGRKMAANTSKVAAIPPRKKA